MIIFLILAYICSAISLSLSGYAIFRVWDGRRRYHDLSLDDILKHTIYLRTTSTITLYAITLALAALVFSILARITF